MAKSYWKLGLRDTNRRAKALRGLLLCTFWLALLAPLAGVAASLTAALETDTIRLGESTTLQLAFEGGDPGGSPQLPAITGLRVAYAGRSSQTSWVNGQTSSTVTHSYSLTPTQPGEITIPSLRITLGGQPVASQPLKLTVLKPDAPAPEAQAQQIAFLRLLLPKKQVYVGEAIRAELQLYLRDVVQGASDFQITGTPSDGLILGKNVQGQQRQTRVGSTTFTVVPFQLGLTAGKTGMLSFGPITATVAVQLPVTGRNRDPFDPFGMFNRSRGQQMALASEEVKLECLPLPTLDRPADFSGAVGNFTLNFTAGPTNVAVGDPITVRVQISGRGPIETLPVPSQSAWRDFKTYPPTTKLDSTDPLGQQGTKNFEQAVVPQNAEIKTLPGFAFSYFDPEARAYRRLEQPAVALTVRPAGSTPPPSVAVLPGTEKQEPARQDIVPIKQRLGPLSLVGPPLAKEPWFLGLQLVPVLAWLGCLGLRRRVEALANNPRRRRQRQVAQIVRAGVVELRSLAGAKKEEAFFATLVRLLQEQLGERLDVPASAITEAVIEERLRPRPVPEATLTALHDLFQRCNQARYAPVRDQQELSDLCSEAERVLKELAALEL